MINMDIDKKRKIFSDRMGSNIARIKKNSSGKSGGSINEDDDRIRKRKIASACVLLADVLGSSFDMWTQPRTNINFVVSNDAKHIIYPATSIYNLSNLDKKRYQGSLIDEYVVKALETATSDVFGNHDDSHFEFGSFMYVDGSYDVYRLPLSVIKSSIRSRLNGGDINIRSVIKQNCKEAFVFGYSIWADYRVGNVRDKVFKLCEIAGITAPAPVVVEEDELVVQI